MFPGTDNLQRTQKSFFPTSDTFKELGRHISGSVKSLPLGKSQSFAERERKISLPQFGSLPRKDGMKEGGVQQRVTAGDPPFTQMDEDDTYEQPSPNPNSNICTDANSSSIQRELSDENSDPDWSDSEWDDTPNLDSSFTAQTDDTYLTPDGGLIQDDYNIPDEMPSKEQFKLQPTNTRVQQMAAVVDHSSVPSATTTNKLLGRITTNGSRDDKKKNTELKKPFETSLPKPPTPIGLGELIKPAPKPKPSKTTDPGFPKLPPRPKEKPLPIVPPFGSTDAANRGSSESISSPSNQEVHSHGLHQKSRVLVLPPMHADLKRVTDKIASFNQHQEVEPTPSPTEAPIYDDGVSEVLSAFDWFHGELEREEGARRVKQLSENGTFLIRASKTDGTNNSHPYTLVVTLDRKVYNLKIRLRPDRCYAIGNYKSEEVAFSTVPQLVDHHKENNIKLSEGGAVRLTSTPRK
jgi:hypothetical protein